MNKNGKIVKYTRRNVNKGLYSLLHIYLLADYLYTI